MEQPALPTSCRPWRRLRLALLLVATWAGGGCNNQPAQPASSAIALFNSAIDGCTAGIAPDGAIDQKALAATGWRVVERKTRFESTDVVHRPDDYPKLRKMEYEVTSWQRPGLHGGIELIRDGSGFVFGRCNVGARTKEADGVQRIRSAISAKLGAQPAREGIIPPGGDWLLPRWSKEGHGSYWSLPRHDLYLIHYDDRSAGLEIVVMPDRSKLDEYSPDRPEARIYVPE